MTMPETKDLTERQRNTPHGFGGSIGATDEYSGPCIYCGQQREADIHPKHAPADYWETAWCEWHGQLKTKCIKQGKAFV